MQACSWQIKLKTSLIPAIFVAKVLFGVCLVQSWCCHVSIGLLSFITSCKLLKPVGLHPLNLHGEPMHDLVLVCALSRAWQVEQAWLKQAP